jgi:hypothetical protein
MMIPCISEETVARTDIFEVVKYRPLLSSQWKEEDLPKSEGLSGQSREPTQ